MALCLAPKAVRQRMPQPRARFALTAVTIALVAVPPAALAEEQAGSLEACLEAVSSRKGEEISCKYKTLLTAQERTDMQRLTRGLLKDASCLVNVKIARALVEPALTKDDHAFEATPQPVTCDITTSGGGFPISATFAPKVLFKGGVASEGTPGLGNVTGVNKYIAWPVVQYVNRAPGIRKSMLEIINRYRAALRAGRKS